MPQVSKGLATAHFLRDTGMSHANMVRAGITMEPCDCGLDCCNGWLAVGARLSSDGRAVRIFGAPRR